MMRIAEEERSVTDQMGKIHYVLTRKQVKNINLRICKDGSVHVSARRNVPAEYIDAFVQSKAAFVRAAQQRLAAPHPAPPQYVSGDRVLLRGEQRVIEVAQGTRDMVQENGALLRLILQDPSDAAKRERLFLRYRDALCEREFTAVLREVYPLFAPLGVPMPMLCMREMKTRWGSCTWGKGKITLNKQLIAAPPECLRFVVMHEYCHFLHHDHSMLFYALLTEKMPEWRRYKALLNQSVKL